MDINKVLMEYDSMFGASSLEQIMDFLVEKLEKALDEDDNYSAITLLNELIGFCRDTSQNSKGEIYCDQLLAVLIQQGLEGSLEYATSLLNIANAYRAFGNFEKSEDFYTQTELIYKAKLQKGDFKYASLYNNWGLLYQETGDFKEAYSTLEKALFIVDRYPNAIIEQATTRTNLAVTLFRLSRQVAMDETADSDEEKILFKKAEKYLGEALDIYEKDGGRDFHYSAALSAMGDAMFIKEKYIDAATFYKKAMQELERHVGKTENYRRVESNYNDSLKRAGVRYAFINNMDRCQTFYENYGKPMIRAKFPEYEDRIAVGLVGEGSDCFGFDDDISKDHDYGIGFCMWLSDSDYNKIGLKLQAEYIDLIEANSADFIDRCENLKGKSINKLMDKRRGVFPIRKFYEDLLGEEINYDNPLLSDNQWLNIDEDKLAVAVNGQIYKDEAGIFSEIRDSLLEYYPDKIWRLRLAKKLHEFSQYGQSNYERMMARHDHVTANLCIYKGIECAMDIAFLLNKTYAPYYKWKRKAISRLPRLSELGLIVDYMTSLESQSKVWENKEYNPYVVNSEDKFVAAFEDMANLILEEMNRQQLVSGEDLFLEVYCKVLTEKVADDVEMEHDIVMNEIQDKDNLINQIVLAEWQQFDKVENVGGRADCQDDWNTFSIMRKSQYMAWNEELLVSYLKDLKDADSKGWNLITEKYARMMESTTPWEFEKIKDSPPVRTSDRIAIQEEIIGIQIEWMEEFARKYPKMAGNARSIHTYEDTPFNTSYETYLRGELGTYSEETFLLYGRFIVSIKMQGQNLAYNIMNNTAKLYGYSSVEDAERRL